MRSTMFIGTPYSVNEMIDEYVFCLIEQVTNTVYTVNGLAVFDRDYEVISRSRREAERTTGIFLQIRACRRCELPGHESCIKENGD